jgi:hypothetical protein
MEISSIATDHQCAAAGTDGRARTSAAVLTSQAAAGTGGPRPRSRIAASDADDGGRAPESPGANAHPARSSSHLDLAVQIHDEWPNIRSEDPQTLEEAKLGLVCRFGEALHMLAGRRHECPAGRLGYAQLYDISRMESSYRIRLAAAQEIGRGGAVAFGELQGVLAVPGEDGQGSQAGQHERDGNGKQGGHGAVHGREAGHGGAVGGKPASAEAQWAQQVSAWLAPLLITSADAAGGDHGQRTVHQDPAGYLEQWLDRVKSDEGSDASLTISQEIALAQGFKYAANRRFGPVHSRPPVLGYLQDEALEMLKHARYWFSQLTLIQALCLWEIQSVETTAGGQHWNPDAIVNHWLDEIGGAQARAGRGDRHIHPFVQAAACWPPGPWRPVTPSASCGWTKVTWSPGSGPAGK